MKSVGIDLHEQSITACVVDQSTTLRVFPAAQTRPLVVVVDVETIAS